MTEDIEAAECIRAEAHLPGDCASVPPIPLKKRDHPMSTALAPHDIEEICLWLALTDSVRETARQTGRARNTANKAYQDIKGQDRKAAQATRGRPPRGFEQHQLPGD
jgi:hypothetical protein